MHPRGGALPNRKQVRPIMIGASRPRVVDVRSWCTVDLANPGTCVNLNGSQMDASSDALSSFDGSAVGKKFILNFEQQLQIPSSKIAQILFGSIAFASAAVMFSGTTAHPSDIGATQIVTRVRLITAAFVTASQNWTGLGSLAIGATIGQWGVGAGTVKLPVLTGAGAQELDGAIGSQFTGSQTLCCAASNWTAYGVLVDVEPTGSFNFDLTATSGLAQLRVAVAAQFKPRVVLF